MLHKIAPLTILAMAAGAHAFVYQWDNGTEATNLSTSGPPTFNVAYLVHYNIQAGGTTLNSISLRWGCTTNPNLPNGLAADVLLMSDPNGDGNPNDAAVLQLISTTTVNSGLPVFNTYNLTPQSFGVGTSFFVGALIHDVPTGSSWLQLSQVPGTSSQNWWNVVVSSPVGSYNPMTIFGSDFTAMVRVNAVPEPATLIALASGAAVLLRRRRK